MKNEIKLPKCKYCGAEFLPRAPLQKTCRSAECERKRRAEFMRNYRQRKREVLQREA